MENEKGNYVGERERNEFDVLQITASCRSMRYAVTRLVRNEILRFNEQDVLHCLMHN